MEQLELLRSYLNPYSFDLFNTLSRMDAVGSATSPRKFFLIVTSNINFEVSPSTVADGSSELVMPHCPDHWNSMTFNFLKQQRRTIPPLIVDLTDRVELVLRVDFDFDPLQLGALLPKTFKNSRKSIMSKWLRSVSE